MTAVDIVLTQVDSSCTGLPAMTCTELWIWVSCRHKHHMTAMIQFSEAYPRVIYDRHPNFTDISINLDGHIIVFNIMTEIKLKFTQCPHEGLKPEEKLRVQIKE